MYTDPLISEFLTQVTCLLLWISEFLNAWDFPVLQYSIYKVFVPTNINKIFKIWKQYEQRSWWSLFTKYYLMNTMKGMFRERRRWLFVNLSSCTRIVVHKNGWYYIVCSTLVLYSVDINQHYLFRYVSRIIHVSYICAICYLFCFITSKGKQRTDVTLLIMLMGVTFDKMWWTYVTFWGVIL